MYRFSLCLSASLLVVLLAGCGPNIPEGIEPTSDPLLPWRYPDTVEVNASFIHTGLLTEQSRIPEPELDDVHRKWLKKHDYVRVSSRIDSAATDLLNERLRNSAEDEGGGVTTGAIFNQAFVRVE